MTNAEPTPAFRRFPWIQLAFCLACLSMAAWTWMRFSYCWRIRVREIARYEWQARPGPPLSSSYQDSFVEVNGTVHDVWRHTSQHRRRMASGRFLPCEYISVSFEPPGRVTHAGLAMLAPSATPLERGSKATVRGRVDAFETVLSEGDVEFRYFLDGTRGRLNHTSIAGLVVGAMGVFIFGLYLRAWLRERKALASQPGRDMIS
ncbi:MAG: hypothetical protein ACYTKD_20795 [Planctomycetota bacterium]